MPLAYAFKRVIRSWQIFTALLIGIILASTFFAGINIKADTTAKKALEEALKDVYVDMTIQFTGYKAASSSLILSTAQKVAEIEDVTGTEVVSRYGSPISISETETIYAEVLGIQEDSRLYDGWLNKPEDLGENETYIVQDSHLADYFNVGDLIQISFARESYAYEPLTLNLTVKGFAELDEKTLQAFSAYGDVLIVDWEKTLRSFIDKAGLYTGISTKIFVYVNRDVLISTWDIDGSIERIQNLEVKIVNTVGGGVYVHNHLLWPLMRHRFTAMFLRTALIVVSLPVFFMAWYMGTTVSDVSFNLRRREIGLLLTKGFSRRQLLFTFLTETLLIGLIGGAIGVLFGFLLNPLFTTGEYSFDPSVLGIYTIAATIVFGCIIAFLSAFRSAKKAANMPAVQALREYIYIEETKPYKRKWPLVALVLGTYKILVFAFGINVPQIIMQLRPGNFIIMLILVIWAGVDFVLTFIGPLLFFWGFTKVFIQGSFKFQELTARIVRSFSELGALATKNVRRNPARTAAIAFLLALIVGYSVQVVGQLASEEDYIVRKAYADVGADVSVSLSMLDNASSALETIVANVSDSISNATVEYSFTMETAYGERLEARAVEPETWLKTAYYEDGWFSGASVSEAFEKLASDPNTIILEKNVAKKLDLNVGDIIHVYIHPSQTLDLKVAGFFGLEAVKQPGQVYIPEYPSGVFWSYVPQILYEQYKEHVYASPRILLNVKENANATAVAEQIRSLGYGGVECVEERLKETPQSAIQSGTQDVQRLGVVFAVLAASAGTALVSAVSMKERSREAAIMSVRGLSYRQMLVVFLTENLATVVFSMILGLAVGFIIVHGNICAANSQAFGLVMRRIVFPVPYAVLLLSCLALIFASVILPVVIMCRRYLTKLERMVRIR